ncbi:MAG: response regulator [Opitutales bacterium]
MGRPERIFGLQVAQLTCLFVCGLALMGTAVKRLGAEQEGADSTRRQVLILQSYHAGFSWSEGVEAGLREGLRGADVELSFEYLDSKRRSYEDVAATLAAYLQRKYAGDSPDLLICVDNNALRFVREHDDTLFPQVPLLFAGINNFSDAELRGLNRPVGGVVEKVDPLGTLRLIRKLQPDAQRLHIVSGSSVTGQAVREEVARAFEAQDPGLQPQPVWLDQFNTAELQGRLQAIAPEDAVLLVLFNRDADGRYYEYEEAARLVDAHTVAPVYGMWDFYLGHGIVGGRLASSRDQGETVGLLAREFLSAGQMPPIVRESPNRAIFSYEALRASGLDPEILRGVADIRGGPERSRWALTLVIGLAALLALILVGSLVGLFRKSRGSVQLAALLQSNMRGVIVLLTVSFLFAVATHAGLSIREERERVRERIYEQRRERIQLLVNQVMDQIAYERARAAQRGIDEDQVKAELKERLSAIRYGGNDGYIFVFTEKGHSLVHSLIEGVEPEDFLALTDRNGLPVVRELIAAARQPRGGFVDYMWEKPGTEGPRAKLSFARAVPDWAWVVGTGVYLEDIEKRVSADTAHLRERLYEQTGIVLVLGLAVLLAGRWLNIRLIRQIDREMDQLGRGLIESPDRRLTVAEDAAPALDPQRFRILEFGAIAARADQAFRRQAVAEAQNRVQQQRLANILEGTHAGTWEWNIQSGETVFNERWAEIIGYRLEELQPTSIGTWMEFTHPKDLRESDRLLREHFEGKREFYEFTSRMRHRNGHWVWVLDRGKVIEKTADGQPLRMFGTRSDVSAQKRVERELARQTEYAKKMAEEAKGASKAKSEFLANMSHEIRTPMNGVVGMVGLLLETELDERQRKFAETAQTSGESLLGLINDILDFSKIEAGKLEMDRVDFDLISLLDDFAAGMAIRAEEKGLAFICSAAPDVPTRLRGDPGRLRQILVNLAGNAIKFTASGEVELRVEWVRRKIRKRGLRFSVRDTGIGIPEEKQDLLFKQFSQVDASPIRQFGGTGLGLAISKQLAELMGGRIGFESAAGEGATFWFTADLGAGEGGGSLLDHADALAGRSIFLVDGNATHRQVLREQLEALGARVGSADDRTQALQRLQEAARQQEPFELVLLDGEMPEADDQPPGLELLQPGLEPKPKFILMAPVSWQADASALQQVGFAWILPKPIRRGELIAGLQRLAAGEEIPLASADREPLSRQFAFDRECRILAVDDNPINQQVLLSILQEIGVRADCAGNGKEALHALATIPYDLVLMDVQMPEMDGITATRKIRSREVEVLRHDVPIIALTAHAMQGDREDCLEAGMDDYLSKPVTPRSVAKMLWKWLKPEAPGAPGARHAPGATAVDAPRQPEPTASPEPGKALWDQDQMKQLMMGNEALIQKVLSQFLDQTPAQVARLADAIEQRDFPEAQHCAHSIKGTASYLGAERLREQAAVIEKAAKEEDLKTLQGSIQAFQTTFSELCGQIRIQVKPPA